MKTIKKFGENIRHTAQVAYINAKHEMHVISDNRYEAEEALETVRHAGNIAHIDHPNNPVVNAFNGGVEIVGNVVESVFDQFDA